IKHFYNDLENVELSALNTLFEKIGLLPSLQGSLQAINDGGFIENFASSELDRIRRQINHDEGRVRQILQDILKKQADHLTETLIASRNGRAVLPV
ncbi:endonuclease MutS2, partial [Enterococcus gallinarum]